MALLDPSPSLNLNETQLAKLDALRQNFVDAIGGPNQNPSDPAYLQRWQTAQQMSDQQFILDFGTQAFMSQQQKRVQQEGVPFAKVPMPKP